MTYWVSKTHVKFDAATMTRQEALSMAKELLVELGSEAKPTHRNTTWTLEMQTQLEAMREAGVPIREIALRLFNDVSKVGAVSGRIRRQGLPVSDLARRRGLASVAARRASGVNAS